MKNTKKKQNNKKKTVKRRDRNYKKGGAKTTLTSTESPLTTIKSPQVLEEVAQEKTDLETRSLEELAKLKEERAIANQEMIEDASTVAKGLLTNTLETAGDLVGIDIDNPEAVNKKLEDIKETFTDPKNLETLTETVAAAAEKGAVVLEAAAPLVDPLAEKALDVTSKTAVKMADTGTTILSNFVKEIPGVGLAYSLIQDATKIGEAASAVVNAAADLTTDTADSAVVFKKNLEELQNEAADIENRTADTVNNFNKPIVIPKVVDDPFPPPAVRPSLAMSAGGGKQITKKKNFKKKNTKRVRFAF
jgi:hypothetical protein